MIKLTESAAKQVEASLEGANGRETALRIAVKKMDDGKFQYLMGLDEIKEGVDFSVVSHGVTVVVDKDSQALLQGATLDYVELEPGEFHFIFMNPNDPDYVPVRDE